MKDTQVKAMFETIAPTYDFQNSFLSLRRDIYWRRALAEVLQPQQGDIILDVAVGTAETALAISRRHPGVRVVGVDFSPAMLQVGRDKIRNRHPDARICLAAGDGRRLPVRSGSVDALTISFGIRNVEERDLALGEFYRVLKPGGRLFIMEFSYPDQPLLFRLYRFYFDHILPPVGNWLSRTDYAYSYLSSSVDEFPDDHHFLAEIGRAGFSGLRISKLTFGIAKIYYGSKGKK
ncbi:MAG: bifunctional demethylmenaquinone methyltransferase/2-methoxy-6-polyprenyl-1,4-benzoquinol methylase UbiE [Desulfobulbaceae bacterium]|nr:bifunctional demethylmenaquinone methyltransferase/2-methoxy-6-polyprenyl-1,4-benzoquinol methylase UbiE [Desulfobulbaceae bacterium]